MPSEGRRPGGWRDGWRKRAVSGSVEPSRPGLENRRRGATSSVGSNPTPAARTAMNGLVELGTRRRARRVRSRGISPEEAVPRNQAEDSQSPGPSPTSPRRAAPGKRKIWTQLGRRVVHLRMCESMGLQGRGCARGRVLHFEPLPTVRSLELSANRATATAWVRSITSLNCPAAMTPIDQPLSRFGRTTTAVELHPSAEHRRCIVEVLRLRQRAMIRVQGIARRMAAHLSDAPR
jgi:hypothetical protein